MPLSPEQEEALVRAASKMSEDQRKAFLDALCAGDKALRSRIAELLEGLENHSTVPDQPKHLPATIKIQPPAEDETIGRNIGPYKLLQKIGEGGCGAVYMAEQEQPVRRRVALKVIKLGMDTKAVIARFEAERQALALMDHPNIARVLDAGATETGRPYFVMELVRGIKFTEYCDQNKLPTRERLELFIKICQAIQHAHQKGIIHRDIKPSNILVTLHDGVPIPKVIDFGIAKATTDQRLTDKTLFTAYEQFIGTPAYMSPEQAEMSGLDVDTRSDIYSLGVLLYELLTGRTPFDPTELMSQGLDAMRKTIREKEPVRPSTKVATLQVDELTTTAARRAAEAPKLVSLLRGDLDWIVMKCLEKDRTRRYETANGLAMDLKRHLDSEPIVARPPSKAYRLQKAFERNRLGFAATGAIAMALLLGIVAATWQAVRAKKAEALALQTRNDAERLSNFILDDFYTALEPSGQKETIASLARQSLAYYDNLPASLRTPDTARNRATAQARLALVTVAQADDKSGGAMAEEALAALEQMRRGGDQSEGTTYALGLALEALIRSRGIYNPLPLGQVHQDIEALRPAALAADGSRRIKLQYAELLDVFHVTQPPEIGMATCEEALRVLAGLGALDFRDLTAGAAWADIADTEAQVAMAIGRSDDGERLEKQVLEVSRSVVARQPANLRARKDLCEAPLRLAYIQAGRFDEEGALRLAIQARQAGLDYLQFEPSAAIAWNLLARSDWEISGLLFRKGRITEALQKAHAAIQMDQDPRNPLAYETPTLGRLLAWWEAQEGHRAEADHMLEAARRSYMGRQARRPDSGNLKQLWSARFDEVECEIRLTFGENEAAYDMATNALAHIELLQKKPDVTYAEIYVEMMKTVLIQEALGEEAQAALNLGRYASAEAAARELLLTHDRPRLASESSVDPPDPVWGRVLLAQAVAAQGRKPEALKTLEPAVATYQDMQSKGAYYLTFRQHFARALYIRALVEAADDDGKARARESLNQAAAQLNALTSEAKELHNSKELFSWIAAEREKLEPTARPQ